MIAYLQCELTARDLDSRLLIAAYLLQAGKPVVVGQVWGILSNVADGPPGVNLFATANGFQAKGMLKCRNAGHPVVVTDEEALALHDDKSIHVNVSPDAMRLASQFLFQNSTHEAVVRQKYPDISGAVTGSARIEMLRQHRDVYRTEAEQCRENGPYVLINTNFALANSVWKDTETAINVAASAVPQDYADVQERVRLTERDEVRNLEAVRTLIGLLQGRVENHRLVLRPHPAENADLWRSVAGIDVVEGSNPLPWILGADLMVHTNSTTGFEAALIGVHCLNIGLPDTRYVMDQVNCSIRSVPEAADAIHAFLTQRGGPIGAFVAPLGDFPPDGARNIAAAMCEAGAGLPQGTDVQSWKRFARRETQRRKFSVTLDQFRERVAAVCVPIVSGKLSITPLDDSIFLMTPN